MDKRTKLGVGFDHFTGGYFKFHHRHKRGVSSFGIQSHRMVYFLHHGGIPEFIDHIDGNTRNNSVANLRGATKSQNNSNRRSAKNSSSKFLGVSLRRDRNKWKTQIKSNGKNIHIGLFTDERDAAMAYDRMAIILHGEFANLNILTNPANLTIQDSGGII